ncbi:MAG: hypothetical protein A3J65_00120 [Candidatus Buchananbacteria bacterium RIFCSPHIGHO2_02_FULL_45_11b]|uniref:Uncharacterized protein n=1 Tax=Candidatus Buchananbacteria bacterium RIFCSPHIGHO2_02_FULL_45_11b TaxID=1797541 RepID=A0A1G1YDA0_9BACT|nr:MAG: hypothetical protein A3J65_00120 [Candidatus Buchananbacteria bacterium RIFCSPHIGHO2_02_FULL_45_11b]
MFKIVKSKLIKLAIFGIVPAVFFSFGFLILVKAQEAPAAPPKPPPPFCGDGVIQSPNSKDQYEKCDDGESGSERCTADCGQKLLGWAWADTIGWVSLNNQTCAPKYLDPDLAGICGGIDPGIDYQAVATANDTIEGWAWSDNAGWICFGLTCNETCEGGACLAPYGNLETTLDTNDSDTENPPLLGWARILSLGDDGWISLNCLNDDVCGASDYQVRLGNSSFGKDANKETRLTLKGWAWNDYLGWLRFDPEIANLGPWLQTKYSDIYARSYLQGALPAPAAICNATYRILAGSAEKDAIFNFCSAQGQNWEEAGIAVNFPAAETLYSNVLGRLDINGLICDFNGKTSCVNRYGTMVEKFEDTVSLQAALEKQNGALGNKIYYYGGDYLIIDRPLAFNNGLNYESGAGTIIVNGNLGLTGDITYGDSIFGGKPSFKNLASVAWIVRGDLKIAPAVSQLAGNFIVLGNRADQEGNPQNRPACQKDTESQRNEVFGCGQIYTCCQPDLLAGPGGPGCGPEDCSSRLTVFGLMMAKKFYFDRTYFNPNETPIQGSEVVIYDGRLLANTPPGLSDFAKALPIWRSGSLAP